MASQVCHILTSLRNVTSSKTHEYGDTNPLPKKSFYFPTNQTRNRDLKRSHASSPRNVNSSKNRPKANFHPGIWGDMFLSCAVKDIDTKTELQYEELKEEVRRMLMAPMDNSNQKLPLIDAVQRLGVSYHFEKEIEDAMETIYHDASGLDNDLYTTALRFRLLRQHGFNIPCDVFKKFKDEEGNFKSSLTSDVRGLLELYEASYMRVHGEDILDDAISFATEHLTLAATSLEHPMSEQVAHALRQSIRRGVPRLEARHYISMYQDSPSHVSALLQFAKIDFNLLQLLHKKELSEICSWWKDLEFQTKLPFARDRVVECYFGILGVYFELQYSLARKMLTKVFAMQVVLDDIYDSYGTYDELIIYTDAIERWNIKYIDQLSEYFKISYKALLDLYEEMVQLLEPQGRQYRVEYVKRAMIRLVQAYTLEAKWTNQKYKPTFEEFKAKALITIAYPMLTITAFVCMGDLITPEIFDWATNDPKIIRASAIICRFMDDMAEHKFNQKEEDDCSIIECYMEQYGISVQETYDEFNRYIENSWKDINEELLKPTEMPEEVLTRSLNFSRMADVIFKDGDGFTHVEKATKSGITSLLIDAIPL